jgi:hypothetical protein
VTVTLKRSLLALALFFFGEKHRQRAKVSPFLDIVRMSPDRI